MSKGLTEDDAPVVKPSEPKPSKVLPTNRVGFTKQLEVLRAFGAVGDGSRAVSNVDVSKLVGIHPATIGLTVPFFAEVGLLKKTPDGMVPSPEVVSFNQAFKWSPDTAANRLAPILGRTWFADTLTPRLRFNPLAIEAAIQELALAASAGPSYKGQLGTLIDYLDASGVVARENGHIVLGQRGAKAEPEREEEPKPVVAVSTPEDTASRRTRPLATSFVNDAGVVQFNISVKVDMTEFGTWEPARIGAFFAGIAQVLAAKGNVEKQAAGP